MGNPLDVTKSMRHKIYNTFGLEVYADRYVEFGSTEELRGMLEELRKEKMYVVGGGANLVFSGDYHGTIVHSAIKGIEETDQADGSVLVRVGSGENWDAFCAEMAKRELYGVENLAYIPGEVGASAIQNVGAYGIEACDVIEKVETVEVASGDVRIFDVKECEYGYRSSIFKHQLAGKYIVTHVTYRLRRNGTVNTSYKPLSEMFGGKSDITPQQVRDAVIEIRRSKLPEVEEIGSAGSFFMNPVVPREKYEELAAQYPAMPHFLTEKGVKIPAAWLIDQCGLKGYRHGNAGVYVKQPLVLVNLGGATAADVLAVAEHVTETVKEKFGIELHKEAIIID